VIWVKVSLGGEDSPDETRDAARIALAGGYRHIDTAAAYGNGGCGRTFLG
jgi:diketogulonate reductase-like aldo/keto reductase